MRTEQAPTLGVALVGYDGAGTQNHQLDMYEPAFRAHEGFSIRLVCDAPDVDAERRDLARAAAERLDVPYVEDLDTALSSAEIAVASVCVAFPQRVHVVGSAARHGLHLLVDKPMALDLRDLDEMHRAVTEAGVVCLPAHHHRFLDSVEDVRRALSDGAIGTLLGIHADFIVTQGATRASAGAPEVWPLGELMNFAVYPIDVIRYLSGSEVRRVHGTRGGYFFGEDNEDLGVLTLTLDRGVVATMCVARTPMTGHPSGGEHRYRLVGSDGILLLDAKGAGVQFVDRDSSRQLPFTTQTGSVSAMLDELHRAIIDGDPAGLGPGDAHAALATTLAGRRSADEHRIIDLP